MPTTTASKKEISVGETALRLKVLRAQVYNLVWAGRLRARKHGQQWLVDAASVDERMKLLGASNE